MTKNLAPVYIVDGARTPFIKASFKPNPLSATQLALACIQPLLLRQPFPFETIEEVIAGCGAPEADELNIGRIIAIRLRAGFQIRGWTVQRNCASGLQALDSAAFDLGTGRYDLVLAGGTECMSRAPFLFTREMTAWLSEIIASKSLPEKFLKFLKFRPRFLKPVIALLLGLNDATVNLSMGQTAEKLAYQFNISREAMDEFSLQSHLRAIEAESKGYLEEICPLYDWQGKVIDFDTGVRRDTTMEKLSRLKPAFDKPFGRVTAGNSAQVTDGAAFLLLANEKMVKDYALPVLGKIIRTTWEALDPSIMGLGPVHAINSLLQEEKLKIDDIDYWEINEAFAGQVLACLKAMEDETYCKTVLKREKPLGTILLDRLNIDGGAIAIGHPIGASGARLVLHLLHILKRKKAKRGVASLCIGGGQGGAMLIENV